MNTVERQRSRPSSRAKTPSVVNHVDEPGDVPGNRVGVVRLETKGTCMRNALFTGIVLALGGVGYAAASAAGPPTEPNEGSSCCSMKPVAEMRCGMGMGKEMSHAMRCAAPATQPATDRVTAEQPATGDAHAGHHH